MSAPRPKAAPCPDGARNENPAGIGFWALVAEDRRTHGSWAAQGFWALFQHRFGNWRMSVRPKLLRAPLTILYRILFKLTQILCGIELPYSIPVGRRVRIEHFGGVIISARRIGNDVILRQNTTLGIARLDDLNARPTLEDGVNVGVGAVILGDVTVGAGAVIGANAVVLGDVPPGATAAGVPARIVRTGAP
ncbi:MAG: serine O-acetyltransferase [Paracoccaceae bacterium]|jgi:serine O-acetyltransferase